MPRELQICKRKSRSESIKRDSFYKFRGGCVGGEDPIPARRLSRVDHRYDWKTRYWGKARRETTDGDGSLNGSIEGTGSRKVKIMKKKLRIGKGQRAHS